METGATPNDSGSVSDPARLLALGLGDEDVPASGEVDLAPFMCARPDLELLECLGRGGMGVVHKARQTSLDRWVAVKLMDPRLAHEPAFADRFTREARAMARLDHPGIVRVIDFGDADGLFYLVMEYVDGTDLRRLMAERLPTAQALSIVEQLCDALDYAHGERVVHRDIKPENVLVDRRGRVRIADFGLAKLQTDTEIRSLTASRVVMGTPQYMAPEQLETPTDVDHRADLFALGVMFYEMLTGHLPIGRFALPSELNQGDAGLDAVVIRTLERDRALRFQDAGQIKQALISQRVDDPVHRTAVQSSAASPSYWKWAGAGAAVTGLLAGALWVAEPPQARLPSPAATDAVVEPSSTGAEPGTAGIAWTERWPDRELALLDPAMPTVVGIDWAEIRQAPLAFPARAGLSELGETLTHACGHDPLSATDKILVGADDRLGRVDIVVSGSWTTEALVACILAAEHDHHGAPSVQEVGPHRRLTWNDDPEPMSVLIAHDGRGHVLLSNDATLDEAGVAARWEQRDDTTLWERVAPRVDRDAPVWLFTEFDEPRTPLALHNAYGSLGFWDDVTVDLSLGLSSPDRAQKAADAVRGWVASFALLQPDTEVNLEIGHEGTNVWVRGPLPWRSLDLGTMISEMTMGNDFVVQVETTNNHAGPD